MASQWEKSKGKQLGRVCKRGIAKTPPFFEKPAAFCESFLSPGLRAPEYSDAGDGVGYGCQPTILTITKADIRAKSGSMEATHWRSEIANSVSATLDNRELLIF
ncbi:hypothetical protein VTO42DRAFT_984 [Malbranchea cinnamomea]